MGHRMSRKRISDIMAWNRLYLRNRIKSSFLIGRTANDGLTPDSILNEAIEAAMKELARDCNMFPGEWKLALRADQYKYPLPRALDRIRNVYFIDSSGEYQDLEYMAQDNFLDWTDPTDTSSEPIYYSYPHIQPPVFNFYAGAPPDYDYLPDSRSWITTASIRTIIDSGINFGRTKSGRRVRPGCVAHNITDDSYGYIEYLDMTTAKRTGWATSGTTTDILEDSGENFSTDNVAVGDIICTPSGGRVRAYAFVIEVAPGGNNDQLRYANIEGQDANGDNILRFENGDTYKVGTATEIRLWHDTPMPEGTRVPFAGWDHPGLRDGADCTFSVSATKATITGTTFDNTTVTGSSTSGAEEDDIAIASGGSHGWRDGYGC
jgi:hypothetical protein